MARYDTRIRREYQQKPITGLSIYTLRPNFVQAVFDYEVCFERDRREEQATLFASINKEMLPIVDIADLVHYLSRFISHTRGEVFESTNVEAMNYFYK